MPDNLNCQIVWHKAGRRYILVSLCLVAMELWRRSSDLSGCSYPLTARTLEGNEEGRSEEVSTERNGKWKGGKRRWKVTVGLVNHPSPPPPSGTCGMPSLYIAIFHSLSRSLVKGDSGKQEESIRSSLPRVLRRVWPWYSHDIFTKEDTLKFQSFRCSFF